MWCLVAVADSPSARAGPTMLRSGAGHPDAAPSPGESRLRDLYVTLNEYLMVETKFQPKLCLPQDSEVGEVTIGARDGAAHVLRSLKLWFDLPTDVLIGAISLFDRFLTKMKVRPCHVPCITVSCMNIAIDEHAERTKQPRTVSIEELVSVSQSTCTVGDVQRMSRVVAEKLSLAGGGALHVAHWLRLFAELLHAHCSAENVLPTWSEEKLLKLVEIAVCDAACVNCRCSELALVILYHQIELELVELSREGKPVPDEAYYLYEIAAHIQAYCNMTDGGLVSTRERLRAVLARYEDRQAARTRQRLVWRLSERTLKVLRPTDRLTSLLPTIEEQHFAVDATPSRNRSGSESEETSDWPRSPVLPVYCDN
ncbi:cyclin G [Leptidea sinapis]|uniref:cyclin G n=1 Tax=Leptidea sinapis TaxID=189913 RepID=UPI0021C47F02|nr:cyclin G [Leptidea sinapis]